MTTYADNSRVRFDYEILEKYTAGIELEGQEVKAIRAGKMSLRGAYILVRGGEVYLSGAEVAPYQPNNTPETYDPKRTRKILLTKKEVAELAKYEDSKGLTIVPISVYNKGRFLKLDLAVVRGKKRRDKRQAIKKRDVERDLKRSL